MSIKMVITTSQAQVPKTIYFTMIYDKEKAGMYMWCCDAGIGDWLKEVSLIMIN